MSAVFMPYRKRHSWFPSINVSHVLRSGLIRVPDVSVHQGKPTMPYPNYPPYVAIAVLSPDDSMEVAGEMGQYQKFDAAHAWTVDPELQPLYLLDSDGLHLGVVVADSGLRN